MNNNYTEEVFESIKHINDHFVDVNKIVHLGVAERTIQDVVLSGYACYLIVNYL